MAKLIAGVAAAFLFAGTAIAGEPAAQTEIVEAEATVEVAEAESEGKAEAVEVVEIAVEAEAAPPATGAEDGVTNQAAAE
jgi:hypothetical protein